MYKNIDSTIKKYLDLIKEFFSIIERVYLFGSYTKGKSTDDSDIYIALIFKCLGDSERFDIKVQLMMLAAQIDSGIEPYPISHDDFYFENPFVGEVKKTGIEVAA